MLKTTTSLGFLNHKYSIAVLLLFVMISVMAHDGAYAQNAANRKPLKHEIQSFRDTDGNLFINRHQGYIISLLSNGNRSDNPNSQSSSDRLAKLDFPEGLNRLKITKSSGRTETIDIRVDGTAPESDLRLLEAPSYRSESITYIGQGLKIGFSAEDNLSGVMNRYWAINNNAFNPFNNQYTPFDTDGNFTIYYYSVDHVGNVEEVASRPFQVDVTGPEVTHQFSGPSKLSILAPEASLQLSATDQAAGVKNIYYWFDDGEPQQYAARISLNDLSNGKHTLYTYAVDRVENHGDTLKYNFQIDSNAPALSMKVGGNQLEQDGTWYIDGSARILIDAEDNSAGISSIRYKINQNREQSYNQPIRLEGSSGLYPITYHVSDVVGNQSERKSRKFFLDSNPPTTSLKFNGYYASTSDGYQVSPETELILQSSDLESGLQMIEYRIGSGNWEIYKDPILLPGTGSHVLEYRATDQVQNTEEPQTTVFLVKEETESMAAAAAPEQPVEASQNVYFERKQALQGPDQEVFLWISSSPADTAARYLLTKSENGDGNFPMKMPENRTNQLSISVEEQSKTYEITIDADAPSSVLSPDESISHQSGEGIIFEPGVSFSITADDNISGVKDIYYSENGSRFQVYDKPLIGYYDESPYVLRYYAVDSVGNRGEVNEYAFRVDATPPITKHRFQENTYSSNLSPHSTIALDATDNRSGVKATYFTLNGTNERTYGGPFKLSELGEIEQVFNTISYYSVDEVGNKEEVKQFNFKLDKSGPVTSSSWRGGAHSSYDVTYIQPSTRLRLSASDTEMEIREIWYEIDGERAIYESPVSFENQRSEIRFAAVDILGNQGEITSFSIAVDGEPPQSTHSIDGESLETEETLLLAEGTKVSISAGDTESGVAGISYSINSENLKPYTESIRFFNSGQKIIRYMASDRVGNFEELQILNLVYDASPPEINLSYSSQPSSLTDSRAIIPLETLVSIKGVDPESEVKVLEYRVDEEPFEPYFRPIPFLEPGQYTLQIRATDLLDNSVTESMQITVQPGAE